MILFQIILICGNGSLSDITVISSTSNLATFFNFKTAIFKSCSENQKSQETPLTDTLGDPHPNKTTLTVCITVTSGKGIKLSKMGWRRGLFKHDNTLFTLQTATSRKKPEI